MSPEIKTRAIKVMRIFDIPELALFLKLLRIMLSFNLFFLSCETDANIGFVQEIQENENN